MKIFLLLPLLFLPVGLNSCVSAWITQTGKTEVIATSRAEAEAAYGKPIKTGRLEKNDELQKSLRWYDNFVPRKGGITKYEIYRYTGLMKDREFGSGAATANAVTLGTSEVIGIPSALVNRATGVGKTHHFFAGYLGNDRLVIFERMDGLKYKRLLD